MIYAGCTSFVCGLGLEDVNGLISWFHVSQGVYHGLMSVVMFSWRNDMRVYMVVANDMHVARMYLSYIERTVAT